MCCGVDREKRQNVLLFAGTESVVSQRNRLNVATFAATFQPVQKRRAAVLRLLFRSAVGLQATVSE